MEKLCVSCEVGSRILNIKSKSKVETGSGVHPTFYPMVTGGKAAEA
jgi:hypothetical protein